MRHPPLTRLRFFPATPDQVGAARRFLAGLLDGAAETSDAVAALSELAANSVVHSRSARPGSKFSVKVVVVPGWLTVSVTDEGGRWRQAPPGETHGRGLFMVQMLAPYVRIGDVETDSPARTVTFGMPLT
jgi:serine/threonine-protein kinase RsbW